MPKIAIFGGSGYLGNLILNQKSSKKNNYTIFSRKKNVENYYNYSKLKKNKNLLKHFDYLIHLAGPNQNQLKKNQNLINNKSKLTSILCDLCISNNVRLIYLSSMQIYKYYGKKDLSNRSEINLKNPYANLHYKSEKIIIKKFARNKKMFTILRMGNVFGFKQINNKAQVNENLIHNLCNSGLKKRKIIIKNGSVQRNFIPSQIFIKVINLIIKKDLFRNSVENIFYKNLNLKDIGFIIFNRIKFLFKLDVDIKIEKYKYQKQFKSTSNKNFKFNFNMKKIYFEIDEILKFLKKNNL